MFKPRKVLEEEATKESHPVKSVFLETLIQEDIVKYVKEALLYTNICVKNQSSFVIKMSELSFDVKKRQKYRLFP